MQGWIRCVASGGENIEHRTLNIEHRREERAKLVGRLRDATPGQGAKERVEETRGGTPRARPAAGRRSHVVEWLHVDGDESLPVQLDMQRVISALELPFNDPETFWKLP